MRAILMRKQLLTSVGTHTRTRQVALAMQVWVYVCACVCVKGGTVKMAHNRGKNIAPVRILSAQRAALPRRAAGAGQPTSFPSARTATPHLETGTGAMEAEKLRRLTSPTWEKQQWQRSNKRGTMGDEEGATTPMHLRHTEANTATYPALQCSSRSALRALQARLYRCSCYHPATMAIA